MHDLLPGWCSLCRPSSSHLTGQVTNQELTEWLRRLRELRELSLSRQGIDHKSPQPGASAGSTANRATSRRRQWTIPLAAVSRDRNSSPRARGSGLP